MQKKNIEKIYIEKIKKLQKYNKSYFDQDSPIVSDSVYDNL